MNPLAGRYRWIALGLVTAWCARAAAQDRHVLVNNFSLPLPTAAGFEAGIETTDAKVGLRAARIAYRLTAPLNNRRAAVTLPAGEFAVPGDGTLRIWVRGDRSGHRLQFKLTHAESVIENNRVNLRNHRTIDLAPQLLDFEGWRDLAIPVAGIPAGRVAWLQELAIAAAEQGPETGTILLDDARFIPRAGEPASSVWLRCDGPPERFFEPRLALLVDVRNFAAQPVLLRSQIDITDRNDNVVTRRGDLEVKVGPGENREVRLEVAPENFETFCPPFRLKAEIFAPEMPQLSAKLDQMLVMGNSTMLFDDFGNVFGRWFTSGLPPYFGDQQRNKFFGEEQRAHPGTQSGARLARVANGAPGAAGAPPGPYAMEVTFNGAAAVHNGYRRHLPGDAYALGVWVHGDGSGAEVQALVIDYTGPGSTFYTWNRHFGNLRLCTLDFEGWRYIEVSLPGRGIGARTPRGSTYGIDYPLELTSLLITPTRERPQGTVRFGGVLVHTQQTVAESLAVQLAYDDPEHVWASQHGAMVTVQNGWRLAGRHVKLNWTLADRDDASLAEGAATFRLEPLAQTQVCIDLAPHQAKVSAASGPLRLTVTAVDDASGASEERTLILSKVDSLAVVADFERERSYPAWQPVGIENPAAAGQAATSTERHQAGARALALGWERGKTHIISIDPALPGVPVEISLWVYGDGSGALFYPLIGDTAGVVSGVDHCQWDLFLPRTPDGPLPNAVRIDWSGWRQLSFRLPPVPATWREQIAVHPFVPSYPMGVHLAVVGPGQADAERGMLYVDAIAVATHLPAAERVELQLELPGESNVLPPASAVAVTLANRALAPAASRRLTLAGGLDDWRGRAVATIAETVTLEPGASRRVALTQALPPGAYRVRVDVAEGDVTRQSIRDEVVVLDVAALWGASWRDALAQTKALRAPLESRFALIEHDWDWTEFHPGNLQDRTALELVRLARLEGQEPFVLLGYSTYWAAGAGYEDMLQGRLSTRHTYDPGGRDWGHAVDIFHVPERLDDWENYVREMMRLAGPYVAGWMVWNTPDSEGALAVPAARFAEMLRLVQRWREVYCPKQPVLLGGLSRETAPAYLAELITGQQAQAAFDGVNVRMDAGRLSPEDGRIPEFAAEMRSLLDGAGPAKTLLLTDLDWAVEKEADGLGAFTHAAYLARAALLLAPFDVRPELILQNQEQERVGFGLAYKTSRAAPPRTMRPDSFHLKPGWLGMRRLTELRASARPCGAIRIEDTIPGDTRCVLYARTADQAPVAAVWRNDQPGAVSFARTGLKLKSDEDLFGGPVPRTPEESDWYEVGAVPTFFTFEPSEADAVQALRRTQVRDGGAAVAAGIWAQQVETVFTPASGGEVGYAQEGGVAAVLAGRTTSGVPESWPGVEFPAGGAEHFEVAVPAGAGLVLRKRYYLGGRPGRVAEAAAKLSERHQGGQIATVAVNGRPLGRWNLGKTEPELSGGLREAVWIVPAAAVAAGGKARIELTYEGPANTAEWAVYADRNGPYPLSALGAIHWESAVTPPRVARNIVGSSLRIGTESFGNGIGLFAPCLIEYPLNGQFKRLTAKVGVDAATQGRGSVVFEVHGDGRKLWNSPLMSGLDKALALDLDVSKVDRLRLVVTDGGDGNRLDAADWADIALRR